VVIAAIKEAALSISLERPPAEVWCVASSGVLTRGLQAAWPHAKHYVVEIGHAPTRKQLGRATAFKSAYDFSQDCPEAERPDFESSVTYPHRGCGRGEYLDFRLSPYGARNVRYISVATR
jgi:hypothetical protein